MAAAPETGPRSVQANASLISACGLYCGCCSSYLKGKCASCMDAATSQNRAWCPVLKCCKEKGYATCAQCTTFTDPRKCPTHHNMISRVIGYCLGSGKSTALVLSILTCNRPFGLY